MPLRIPAAVLAAAAMVGANTAAPAACQEKQPASEIKQAAAPTTQPQEVCYSGPIEVRVLEPDGRPAKNVSLGIFGAVWYSATGEDPPPRLRDRHRTDEHGKYEMNVDKECEWPTMFYAYDEARRVAGFCVVERLADLAKPQTVRLRPARWVKGRIVSSERERTGKEPGAVVAHLYPVVDGVRAYRNLRYIPSASRRFRFLVPPGEYRLDVGGVGLERRADLLVKVPAGEGAFDLGAFDLPMSPLARLQGKPAPEWEVVEWSDGQSRTLGAMRGRRVVICFWNRRALVETTVRSIFDMYERVNGIGVEMILIHPPVDGGLAEIAGSLALHRDDEGCKGLELDIRKWPFPTAVDGAGEGLSYAGLKYGKSQEPYGKMAYPTFILVDETGRVAASSATGRSEYEKTLELWAAGPD